MPDGQIEFIISYLRKKNIVIDFEEYKFQVETHPNYPSLYAFSDTLRFFHIDNLAAKVSKENIEYLPDTFMALIKPLNQPPFLSFIEKVNNGYTYAIGNKKEHVNKQNFIKIYDEVVLVVEKTGSIKDLKPQKKQSFWILGAWCILLVFFNILIASNFSSLTIYFFILSCAGLYFSIEALKQALGESSPFAEALCGPSSLKYSSNCNAIITSKKSKRLFNLELSDLSIVFFSGHLLSLFIMTVSGLSDSFFYFSLILLGLTFPVNLYSIFFQWQIEKKWCPICLMIISVLILEIVLLVFLGNIEFNALSFQSSLSFILGFLLMLYFWTVLKPKIKKFIELQSTEKSLFRFKRNYHLFKSSLKASTNYDYENIKSTIIIGDTNSKLKLTLVTNPFCGHCNKAHQLLDKLLTEYPNDIMLNIRFNLDLKNANLNHKVLHFRLIEIYFEKGGGAFMDALSDWFKHKNLDNWITQYGGSNFSSKIEQLISEQYRQNQINDLLFTPSLIIDRYLYPKNYSKEDIVYFINEILEDEEWIL
ncbi:vitamin K epoxide reductase family protein [Flagellimonas sp.]|uniref:vitamin K epoxide reductase family protein n=1 Tax=Flagellimonas sp. TaxID=2058762 RepID=UPI003BAD02F4